ncbi:MAG: hemolysin III family protein [Firmicutes bacterium]|nr:hemolysin III family protein [Bacillota bacterium]
MKQSQISSVRPRQNRTGLHDYTKGEEILNVISHATGALFGIFVLVFGILLSLKHNKPIGIPATVIYAFGMIFTYTVSSVYHGLSPNAGKRVLRVIDHCTIYLLIAGTYTGIMLTGMSENAPVVTAVILSVEWVVGILAITLTAVDMKKYAVFSMICYIGLGWCIAVVPRAVIASLGIGGLIWLLCGGIAYTIGSVLYAAGHKKRYAHGVFHLFCLLGSVLQFVAFALFCF